jgi:hypothetical protein
MINELYEAISEKAGILASSYLSDEMPAQRKADFYSGVWMAASEVNYLVKVKGLTLEKAVTAVIIAAQAMNVEVDE